MNIVEEKKGDKRCWFHKWKIDKEGAITIYRRCTKCETKQILQNCRQGFGYEPIDKSYLKEWYGTLDFSPMPNKSINCRCNDQLYKYDKKFNKKQGETKMEEKDCNNCIYQKECYICFECDIEDIDGTKNFDCENCKDCNYISKKQGETKMKKTIEVSEETYEKIKSQLLEEEKVDIKEFDDLIGQKFFFRTVTFHLVGKVEKRMGTFLELSTASWVADSGRFMDAIKKGTLGEAEPVGTCWVNLDTVTDFFPWKHDLPTKQI